MKKIGILQTAFLGDTVLIAEMIGKLNKIYGDQVQIHLIVRKGVESIFENDPRVTSITTFDKKGADRGILGLFRTIRKIRRIRLNIMLNVHRSLRSSIIALLSGAKKVIGFKSASLSLLYSKRVLREGSHEVDKNHKLLEALDKVFLDVAPIKSQPYKLYAPEKNKRKDLSSFEKGTYIVIAPGSKWQTKRWTLDGYIELINRLLKSYVYKVILTGDKGDIKYSDSIASRVNSTKRLIDLTGKLEIEDLFHLISKARLVITNDSAPQHIAVGLGVSVVSIFGPTVKELGFYPYSNKAIVVENKKIICRPCGLHGHNSCPKGTHECMVTITPIEVFEAVENLL